MKVAVAALVFVLGLGATRAFAQAPLPDYVVTTAGDTLRGIIQLPGISLPPFACTGPARQQLP
ncbi:hypothetical protein [Hymenobacter cellulosilyticus]|uniref:Uncharacterized protein n=1 Tax=Hymenobacter cellulosilyticus TaxID=2932248 RepID=A0A8T9Q9S8_9BACT|nr:hypothetical protein [Hymenobacter cellulosilyticus]UOQ71683.1 hypothetical protein MUN79_24245 [Hymenobacter cellulosilyticus]